MNPEEPSKELLSPKACILIHSSRKITEIHGFNLLLDDGPAYQDYNNCIIKTLEQVLAGAKDMELQLKENSSLR